MQCSIITPYLFDVVISDKIYLCFRRSAQHITYYIYDNCGHHKRNSATNITEAVVYASNQFCDTMTSYAAM